MGSHTSANTFARSPRRCVEGSSFQPSRARHVRTSAEVKPMAATAGSDVAWSARSAMGATHPQHEARRVLAGRIEDVGAQTVREVAVRASSGVGVLFDE